ncbi:hypothetical protein GU926_08105 [Nibribacter ruber]|uniref:Bacteriophage tail tape measure N-terminal domain-containing protein n=1 Tax=Nibribacter ruber TaxID=2698458 RepID=A0A6P1NZI2_9BACT|nr:hypothetical protein [Nibribacter ruber]QHL87398.1 hypothetical protein GU926_08105 [Nibribacter ruber]
MASTDKTTREIEIIANGEKFNASIKEMAGAQAILNAQINKMAADDPKRKDLIQQYQSIKQKANEARAEINGLAKAQTMAASGGGFFKQMWGNALGVFTGGGLLAAAQQLWGLFTTSQKAFEGSAQINSQLEAGLKSTAYAAGITKAEIEALAEERMGKTLFDDDATKGAATLLLTFTEIKKGVFEEALPAIQDMAQKMAGDGPADLKGASIQVGKALNDPIKGITALSKVGVSFTADQKEMIKGMVETGDKAGAQRMILAELNKEFGGSAEAARKAGGGWASLQMTLGELQETLGGFVQNGLNKASDFLGQVMEKSEPVVAIFRDLWGVVTDLWDDVMGLVEGMGLFNSQGDAASAVVEGLRFVFELLVAPIKGAIMVIDGLIEGFVKLYNSSGLVRGHIGGLAAIVSSVFTSIKNAAVNVLGGVADLLVGIFTLDVNKIKSGLKKTFDGVVNDVGGAGARAGMAYIDGYTSSQDKRIKTQKEKAAAQAEEEKIEAAKKGEAVATAETEAQKKAREKAEKEAKKAAEKAAKELAKAREEFNKAEMEAEIEFAKLKVEVMEDGIDKVLAKLRLQHELEKRELNKQRTAVLDNIAATGLEKMALIDNLDQQQKLKDEELKAAEQAALDEAEEKRNAKEQEDLEKRLAKSDEEAALKAEKIQNDFLTDQAVLEEQSLLALEAEMLRDERLLELKKATAVANLAILEEANQGESLAAKKLKNEILATDKEIADGKIANEKRTAEFKDAMFKRTTGGFKEVLQAGIDFFSADEAMRKKNASVIKAFSKGMIAVNLAEEIQGIWKTANENPANALFPGAGMIIASVKTASAIMRANSAAVQVNAQQFATGGMTSRGGGRALINMVERNGMWETASGYSGGSIGSFADGGFVGSAKLGLIGERGAELVIPNWMISSPKYANTVGWLESERVKGARAFAEGGMTAADAQVPGAPSAANSEMIMLQMVAEMRAMRTEVASWPKHLQVHNNVGETQEGIAVLNVLTDRSSA